MTFTFTPADFIPFRDKAEIDRVRALSGEQLTHHANPDFRITIIPDDMAEILWVSDMFAEIVKARDEGRRCVMIIPNPAPSYRHLARLINRLGVDCSHVTTVSMDEWANEDGVVADESYSESFVAATMKFLYGEINPELRMPVEQILHPTTENIGHYSDLIAEAGGADVCYSGPGWTGHLAFIEPDVPEFSSDLDEFLTQGARITSLNPLTIAQNSLHGCFGSSGDMANVPPKAATIGPLDVVRAKRRFEMHSLTTRGTFVTWQRLVSRLVLHGPVTPQVPSSILQRLGADVFVSETLAAPIEADPIVQY